MSERFFVLSSNRVECLLDRLIERLYEESRPFTRRIVAVSSPMMKRWLMWKIAEKKKPGIAMGLEVCYLKQSLNKMLKRFSTPEAGSCFPSRMELAFGIEREIRSDEVFHQKIRSHLKIDGQNRRSEKKIARFSDEMASLFLDYGVFGEKLIEDWENGRDRHWQSELWNALYRQFPHWSIPCRQFSAPLSKQAEPEDVQLHLFGLNFLSGLHLRFLKEVSMHIPVTLYHLSPTDLYWGDLLSDRELAGIEKRYESRQPSLIQLEALDEILMDRHPLLANLGRLGRKMQQQIIDLDLETLDAYQPSHSTSTLLQAVQEGLYSISNPESAEKVDFPKEDGSIQVHICPSRRREVETLLMVLMKLIREKGTAPNEIIVTAPDISPYVPYIETIFEGHLPTRIEDLNISSQSRAAKALLKLIALANGRWEVNALIELFELKPFARRHRIDAEDLKEIRKWLKGARVKWGADIADRNALLKEKGCRYGQVEKHEAGTWTYGFDRLLDALVYGDGDVEFSESGRLGKLIFLFRSLKKDLAPMKNNHAMSLKDWGDYLQSLYKGYFLADLREDREIEDQEALFDLFRTLRTGGLQVHEEYRWTSVLTQLEQLLQKKTGAARENQLHAVQFCSMVPMRAIPAKVIAILGMEEAEFPRKTKQNPNDLLEASVKGAYRPTTGDLDKYLFLETLLSPRENLIISYSQLPGTDEPFPSIYLTEFLSYLDSAFTLSGLPVSSVCQVPHPEEGFHKSYFSKNSSVKGISLQQFQRAKAFYGEKKEGGRVFFPEFAGEPPPEQEKPLIGQVIELKELFSAAKNPFKTYFNQTLGMWIRDEEKEKLEEEEQFILDGLDKYHLKQEALHIPLEEVVAKAENQGILPPGLFKEIAQEELEKEIGGFKKTLDSLSLTSDDLLTIELTPFKGGIEWIDSKHCFCPALQIDGIQLQGELSGLTRHGLLIDGEDSSKELAKNWPKILILNCLDAAIGIEKSVVFLNSGKKVPASLEKPEEALRLYLQYYNACLNSISLLLPEWSGKVKEGNEKTLSEWIQKKIRDPYEHQYNDYLNWSLEGQKQIRIDQAFLEKWKKYAVSEL